MESAAAYFIDQSLVRVFLTVYIINLDSRAGKFNQIHGRSISLRFLGIILRVLRLEVSVYNVYIYTPVSITSKEENSEDFCPNYLVLSTLTLKAFLFLR
jgi:hypothetical protein